jgi:hypothetical protein
MRIILGGGFLLLLLWLLFSSSPDKNFYGIMIDAGSTGSSALKFAALPHDG